MSLFSDTSGEVIAAVSKSAPPLAVTAATFIGMSLQEWVYATTIAYTVIQTVLLICRFLKERSK